MRDEDGTPMRQLAGTIAATLLVNGETAGQRR
jgi:hypothetical protein